MRLTHEQLQENIKELRKQGAPQSVIEKYVKSEFEAPDLGVDSETFKAPGVLGSAARFLGVDKAASYAGAKLAQLDPQHRENLATVEQQDPNAARILSRGGDFTNRELIGSAANVAMNVALPFAGKALSAGSTAARIGKGAATGAAAGMFGGLESGQSNSGVILSTLLGGAIGGAIPAIGAGMKKLASAGEGVPEKLYSGIFKNAQDDVYKQLNTTGIKNIQDTDPTTFKKLVDAGMVKLGKDGLYRVDDTVAKQALDRGLKGSIQNMSNQVVKMKNQSELAVREITDNYKPKIAVDNKKGLLNVLEGIRSGFVGQYDEKTMMKQVNNYIKEVKTGKVSAKSLLEMRRLIDSQRIASSYRAVPTGKISLTQESYKAAADSLRSKLNNLPGMGSVMKDYSFSIDALEALAKEAQRKGNAQVIGLIDSILFAGGTQYGGPMIGLGGAIARHTLSAAPAVTYGAQALRTLGRATSPIRSLTGRAIEASKPAARTALYNTINKTGRVLGQ